MRTTWAQALAWRLGRQLLAPVGTGTAPEVVARLGALPAWPAQSAELAVRARRQHSRPGEVSRASDAGEVVKAYTFRGATHLMSVESAADYLALRATSRQWELPSWTETYGLAPADWPSFREAVRDAVTDSPLARGELAEALAHRRDLRLAAAGLTSRSDTLLKALMWQGDLCFGPTRDGQETLRRLDLVPGWPGLPDTDDAGRRAVVAYLRTYGPATPEHLTYWLGEGLSAGRRAVRRWLGDLDDRLARLQVDGEPQLLVEEDAEELLATSSTSTVRFLPGHDQWVMGPGTADPHVVPPAHRSVVSRGAHLAVVGGVVSGTWSVKGDHLSVGWFPGVEAVDPDELADEAERVLRLTGSGRKDP